MEELCANPITIGTIIYDKINIYLFTKDKVFIFNTQTDNKPNGNMDPIFSALSPETIEPTKKWVGFNPNEGRFFVTKNELYVILNNKVFSCWDSSGKQISKNQPIGGIEKEAPDEPDGNDEDGGALVNSDDNDGKYAKIKDNSVGNLVIEENKLYIIGKYSPIDIALISNKYPPDIIAAIKTIKNIWYFIKKGGKYCKRIDKVLEEVIEV
jgi:hypothetical protein